MNTFPSFRFWLGWTAVHGLAFGGMYALLAAGDERYPMVASMHIAMFLLGLVQPLLLRGPGWWIGAWLVLTFVSSIVSLPILWTMTLGLGSVVCLCQCPLLTAAGFRRVSLWPLLGGLGWVMGHFAAWMATGKRFTSGPVDRVPGYGQVCLGLAIVGLCYGAVTGYALALMRPVPTTSSGTLFYDGACSLCQRWVKRLGFIARQGGFGVVPFQSAMARRYLGLAEGELPSEMKLRLADGQLLGGVDAFIAMAEAAGWTAPYGWFLRLPGVNPVAWRIYRWIAANRYCMAGQCKVEGAGAETHRKEGL